jgi:ribosome recycling factor
MQKESLLLQSELNMKKTIMKLKEELFLIKTGRANNAFVNTIQVNIHGSFISIRNLATINVIKANIIEIIPWDVSYLSNIEKAILTAKLGLTPIKENKSIRIIIPMLTEESRKELIKKINNIGESFKIIIRQERRMLLASVKKMGKSKLLTKDEQKKYEIEAQKLTDNYITKINNNINIKSKEILTL